MGEDFPLFMLPYAVDNDWFQQQANLAKATRPQLQAGLNLDPARPVILFASKLQTRKLCDQLVTAYAALDRRPDGDPHPYLLIVGDGEERVALEQQVAASGLKSVRFCGFKNQSEMPRYLELADVFVLPARHEPWGLIVNEAMNAGCAIIVSDDVGAQPDLVTDGVEGCVYPVGDVPALTDALRRVFATPATAEQMGRRGFARIGAWNFEADLAGLRRAIAHVSRRVPAEV